MVVSESLDAPDLAQTAQALAPFLEDGRVPRPADAWDAGALADHLLALGIS